MAVERKTFELGEEYDGNIRVVYITEHRKAFSAFIRFRHEYVRWFCEVLDMACWESDPATIVRSTDDGSRVFLTKGALMPLAPF